MIVSSVMPQRFWDRMDTIHRSPRGDRTTQTKGRFHFWEVAQVMAEAKPVTGVGFNGFDASYDAYDTSAGNYGEDRSVHSVWFGTLAELGYPGLVLFVAILLLGLWSCRQIVVAAKREPSGSEMTQYAQALSNSLIVFAVGGTFLPGQYSEMSWHFFGLTFALHAIMQTERAAATVQAQEPAVQLRPALAR